MTERFEAVLLVEGKTATYIDLPLDVPAVFGGKRVPVRGTVNGAPFRSTIAVYGDRYFLPINRELREAARAAAGETVTIELERDDQPRVVRAPADLREALAADRAASTFYKSLSYSHKREYIEWIRDARRPETRRRRVARAVTMLCAGKTQR
jgi:Bacteriocin-protection, YdeI or OmpD-Associated/Domain of unknown function (DUF1905)